MTIAYVNTSTLITAAKYDEIQTAVRSLLTTYYGGLSSSVQLTGGTLITNQQWLNLYNDLSCISAHQNNEQAYYVPGTFPDVGSNRIKADFVNTLIADAATLDATKGTNHSTAQMSYALSGDGAVDSARVDSWASTLTHRVLYNWNSDIDATHFFNLGGRITLQEGYVEGSGDDVYARAWMREINWMNDQLAMPANQFSKDNFDNNTTKTLTTSSGIFYPVNGEDYDIMTVAFSKLNGHQVQAQLTMGHIGTSVDLDVTSTATYYYSRGDVTPRGIPAPRPSVTNIQNLGEAGTFVPFPTKVLNQLYALGSFNWHSLGQSSPQTVTLNNSGNTTLTITGIDYTDLGGVTHHANYSSFGTFPVTLAAGASKAFTLYYSGDIQGTWNSSFTILSDNDRGNFTVQTTQVVSEPVFVATASPSSWSPVTNNSLGLIQTFGISTIGYPLDHYTASLSDNTGYVIHNDPNGPTVYFEESGRATGIYTNTLTIVAYGVGSTPSSVTITVPISINYTVPVNSNIGQWISPLSGNNAVIGMSYDVVNGTNFLTIGVGMAGDSTLDLANGGISNISLDNLGVNADLGYGTGIVLYKAVSNNAHCQFLNDYGAWINPSSQYPLGFDTPRRYTITVPSDGTYSWSFAADNYGWFDIDGVIVGDLRTDTSPFEVEHTGSVYLTAGTHSLLLHVVNVGGPGAIGIRIYQGGLQIWSTLDPIRLSPAYPYWQEVYRIPLTKGPNHTYSSIDYLVKNYQPAVGNPWGAFFGNGSMFYVTDDGYGNLDVQMQARIAGSTDESTNRTLINLEYLFYYYTQADTPRYRQLETGPIGDGTQTHYFLGFDRLGRVRTSVVTYPSVAPDYTVPVASSSSSPFVVSLEGVILSEIIKQSGIINEFAIKAWIDPIYELTAETWLDVASGGIAFVILHPEVVTKAAEVLTNLVTGAVDTIFSVADDLWSELTGDSIICTKLHELGYLPDDVYAADTEFGQLIKEHDPEIYDGYVSWAQPVVDWIDGKGPNILFWIKDEERKGKIMSKWILSWTKYISIPWAEEMAYRMGVREESNLAGRMLMAVGLPFSKIMGKIKSDKPAGFFKGITLIAIAALLLPAIAICKLIDRKK